MLISKRYLTKPARTYAPPTALTETICVRETVPMARSVAARARPALPHKINDHGSANNDFWVVLKDAIHNSSRARVECQRALAASLVAADSAFAPHGPEAQHKARGFLSANGHVLHRMQRFAEQLEAKARAAEMAHAADVSQLRERLHIALSAAAEQSDNTISALMADHETHVARAADVQHALQQRLEAERARLTGENDSMHSELEAAKRAVAALEAKVQETAEQAAAEHAADRAELLELRESNEQLREDACQRGAHSERSRLELHGQVERLTREKRALEIEFEEQVAHLQRMREDEVRDLQAQRDRSITEHQRSVQELNRQLEASLDDRSADAAHYEAKIERLQALNVAALKAGSARGRQLLYAESMRAACLLPCSACQGTAHPASAL